MTTLDPLLAALGDVVAAHVLYVDQLGEETAGRLVAAGWVTRVRLSRGEAVTATRDGLAAWKRGDVGERHAKLRPRQR